MANVKYIFGIQVVAPFSREAAEPEADFWKSVIAFNWNDVVRGENSTLITSHHSLECFVDFSKKKSAVPTPASWEAQQMQVHTPPSSYTLQGSSMLFIFITVYEK